MASDKSAQFASESKKKELEHRLPHPFPDARQDLDSGGAAPHRPTQRQFGGKFITETPDEDLRMKMKAQFAADPGKPLGQTFIENKDYDYFIKKHKQERYLKALNFYDQIFDLRDPYQVKHIVKRVGMFQNNNKHK